MLQGSMVALVTPFRNDQIDEPALKRLIELHVEGGTSAIVPCGTTGESATLSFEEHERVIELTVQAVRGRIPVIAGTGSNNTREAIRLTAHAKAATFAQLSTIRTVVAVKESSGNLEQMSRILQLTQGRLTLLSGDDALTLPVLAIGGTGVISVAANLVPRDVAAMVAAFRAGRMEEALQCHQRLLPLVKALFLETNPIPVKTAMGLLGLIEPELRLPLCEMSEANEARLRQALEAYGLLKPGVALK
ncbi:MAG: 4-hydroxy-tetrahydrodipicolinate synthase [Candidatus Omnitrophica bacterium]|nr:4-hydroxy-tetrahydrodipicolinate synthase [Candidatus Omnitrophota bacterium]